MSAVSPQSPPRVTAIVLGYGDEAWLTECIDSVLASTGVAVSVLLVDNGVVGDQVSALEARPAVRVLRPGRNLGFAGGVVLAAEEVSDEFLALVNSDVIVEPDALAALVAEAARPDVGICSACVTLGEQREVVNSVGNPLHVLGFAWAGGFGSPVSAHPEPRDIATATGACAVMRTDWWQTVGGFASEYFAYAEDVDISWRTWQRGRRVTYVPSAVAHHYYEFSRSPLKYYLLERNRLLFLLTTYETRTLLLLSPLLLLAEAAVTAQSILGGWFRQKVRGWAWLLTHRAWVASRRRSIQRARTVSDRELAPLWSTRFDPGHEATPTGAGPFGALVSAYWGIARRLM